METLQNSSSKFSIAKMSTGTLSTVNSVFRFTKDFGTVVFKTATAAIMFPVVAFSVKFASILFIGSFMSSVISFAIAAFVAYTICADSYSNLFIGKR